MFRWSYLKRWWFVLSLLLVLVAAIIGLAQEWRYYLSVIRTGFSNSPLGQVERWQRWADKNRELFEGLKPGAEIAVLRTLSEPTGLVLSRKGKGLRVWRCYRISNEHPGVILVMSEETARRLLDASSSDEDDSARSRLRTLAQAGQIEVYVSNDRERLKAHGFAEFLRAINARVP